MGGSNSALSRVLQQVVTQSGAPPATAAPNPYGGGGAAGTGYIAVGGNPGPYQKPNAPLVPQPQLPPVQGGQIPQGLSKYLSGGINNFNQQALDMAGPPMSPSNRMAMITNPQNLGGGPMGFQPGIPGTALPNYTNMLGQNLGLTGAEPAPSQPSAAPPGRIPGPGQYPLPGINPLFPVTPGSGPVPYRGVGGNSGGMDLGPGLNLDRFRNQLR